MTFLSFVYVLNSWHDPCRAVLELPGIATYKGKPTARPGAEGR